MEITTQVVRDYLLQIQGQEVSLPEIRRELNIVAGTKSFDSVRNILFRLAETGVVHLSNKRGFYKVVTQVKPVQVFGVNRERRPPFDLNFPVDGFSMEPMSVCHYITVREGDLILISGLSNFGKTALCINFLAENLAHHPVLMGNEYTSLVEGEFVPSPRFVFRLEAMDSNMPTLMLADGEEIDNTGWVQWTEDGKDRFTLLPVMDDYAEHIVKDKINIIDWINIATGEHYLIGSILEKIKRKLGRGIAIVAIQKGEGLDAGRGGQFTKDFADVELLLDRFGKTDVLMTIGKVKEAVKPITGNTYTYSIGHYGTKIVDFRQVEKCHSCHGTGKIKEQPCETCMGRKFTDVVK